MGKWAEWYDGRVRLLDLFCGAGGAAMGYYQAGFTDIIGVDINPQPNYPFRFIQADALEFMDAMIDSREDIGYDLVHASPPCQAYSSSTADPAGHPDLIAPTREALEIIGRPSVIENVPFAPLRPDLRLCGSMFGLPIWRHRLFETTWMLWGPPTCRHQEPPWQVTGHLVNGDSIAVRHRKPSFTRGKDIMEMPWVQTPTELTEAIPPAYTRYIGEDFIAQVG